VNFEIVTLSKPGGREYNEDVYGHWSNGRFMACLVADGAGGHGGGDVAASTARSSILGGYARVPSLDGTFLKQLLEQANLDVVARQAEGGKLAAMRTTAVLAVLDTHEQALMWAHSGDSRAYLFRDGAIVARTVDHSLVQQMVAGGMLDEEGARLHPQRNMLLSALGSVSDPLEVDVSGRMRLQTGTYCCFAPMACGRCWVTSFCSSHCTRPVVLGSGLSCSMPRCMAGARSIMTTTRP
jgi:serine/threonine protein phosphatase PrpC